MVGSWQSVGAEAAFAPKDFLMQPKVYAKYAVLGQWHSLRQDKCLDKLWTLESHWNPKASNPQSTAYGIPQFLDQTWVDYHYPIRPKSALTQITAGLDYIHARYENPCAALRHEKWKGWY